MNELIYKILRKHSISEEEFNLTGRANRPPVAAKNKQKNQKPKSQRLKRLAEKKARKMQRGK